MKAWGRKGMKIYTNKLGHMTNMAAMPVYGKNLKKSSSPEPIDQWPWNLVCSIAYGSTTKVVQIMTLGWPWPILRQGQIWSHRLLYGKKWKLFIFWKLLQPWVSKLLEAFSLMSLWSWVSIKGQGHSLISVKGNSDFNVKTCFSQKQLGSLGPKLIWKLEGEKEWKFIQISWVTWPTWPPCPYMVKTLKNLLLQN